MLNKFLFVCIFLWGVAIRGPEVISRNYLFGYDQGWNFETVRSIVDGHKLTLIGAPVSLGSPIGGLFHGPGYYYLLAIPYILFQGDPYGSLVLMFIIGCLVIPLVYILVCRIAGTNAALISMFFAAASPAFISQSRFLWPPHPATLLILVVFILLQKSLSKPGKYLPLTIAAAAAVYHFHLAVAVVVFVPVLVFSVIFIRPGIKTYLLAMFFVLLIILPAILFEVRHGFLMMKNMGGNGLSLTFHLMDYWYNFAGSFDFGGLLKNTVFQTIFFLGIIFLPVFSKPSVFVKFLLITIGFSWLTFSFIGGTVWDYYLTPLHVVFIILAGFTIDKISGFSRFAAAAIIILFITASVVRMERTYRVDFPDYGGTAKIRGKTDAIDWIYRDADGRSFNVLTFMPPVYTYPYDYLFYWWGKKTYGYVSGNEKKGLVYLLIEPDGEKPWSYNGWLETVIVDGDIIDTVTLPSGHIVQKRIFP